MLKNIDKHQATGWIAVALSTLITCFWAFWGIVENFHEGWYYPSLISNLGLMFAQYLTPMLLFMGVALVSIFWPRLGGTLHLLLVLFAAWFFHAPTNPAILLLIAPLAGLGALYWVGRPRPRKLAMSLVIGLPLLTLVVSGIAPASRTLQRLDDGDLGARLVQGNGVQLVWSPDGPGWPRSGASWEEARQACEHLAADGLTVGSEPLHTWRLPTVQEAVRSQSRHGQNSGGTWVARSAQASYDRTPDKESPLWNIHSQVIYWWTATEIDEARAYIIVYDGKVWPRSKSISPDYLGFRCVKNP